ncbi:DUF1906 domain-containing protein [Mucilaginibacter sp. AW1-3]
MANNSSPGILPGTVQQAVSGAQGFDVNVVLTASSAAAFKSAGYTFCIRYIPRTAALAAGNLTTAEALVILNAGLALMAVQHVALPGWAPTAVLGTQYGGYAAIYSKQIGLPQGMNIWLDLEEVAAGTPPAQVIAYCQAWYAAVHAAGYVPGIYVGYGTLLGPQQLYQNLSFQHYWRAYNGPDVAGRGYQLVQSTEKTLHGITFDPDMVQVDHNGGLPLWFAL